MAQKTKNNLSNEWLCIKAKSKPGQKLLGHLFCKYYEKKFLSFFHNNPEWYAAAPEKHNVHYNKKLDIAYVDYLTANKKVVVVSLFLDIFNTKQMSALSENLKKTISAGDHFYFVFSKDEWSLVKNSSLGSTIDWPSVQKKIDGHYIVDTKYFNINDSISDRLLRVYTKNKKIVNKIEWRKANKLDVSSYLKSMKEGLFRRGISVPSLPQLRAQVLSNNPQIQYWSCLVEGEYEGQKIWTEIIVGVLKTKKFSQAKFLHHLDNRDEWKKSWISPGTVAHIEIIKKLQQQHIPEYNLGTFHKKAKKLSEYKAQFKNGKIVPLVQVSGTFIA